MIDCTNKIGRYDDHGVARHGYDADAPFIDTPQKARRHYCQRFGIEATYRLSESSLISPTRPIRLGGCCSWLSVCLSRTSGSISTGNTWRHAAEVGIASGGGSLRSSFAWSHAQLGTLSQLGGQSQQITHLMTDSIGNHRPRRDLW